VDVAQTQEEVVVSNVLVTIITKSHIGMEAAVPIMLHL
jgi:hypothetical protein